MGGITKKERDSLNKFMFRLFENIENRSSYFTEKVCNKCQRKYVCFPEGYMFEFKEIDNCDRIPEIVKIWFQAKNMNVIVVDYPLKISDFSMKKREICD
jgi:hypothetical protein